MACISSLEARPSCTPLMIDELCGALIGLLEQALRLVEQARVLQRHAHRAGERLQQAHI